MNEEEVREITFPCLAFVVIKYGIVFCSFIRMFDGHSGQVLLIRKALLQFCFGVLTRGKLPHMIWLDPIKSESFAE